MIGCLTETTTCVVAKPLVKIIVDMTANELEGKQKMMCMCFYHIDPRVQIYFFKSLSEYIEYIYIELRIYF